MDNKALATEIYEFLRKNDPMTHFADIPAEECIAEVEDYLSDIDMIKDTIRDIENISDDFSDYDTYVSEAKPLINSLRGLQEKLEAEQSRRMVASTGYEVKTALHIGDREIIIAEDMNEPEGLFYMKAEYTENGIVGQYDRIIYSSEYIEVMSHFAASVERQIAAIRETLPEYAPMPITPDKCHPHDYSEDLNGKVVAIKASSLRPEYRREDVQLVCVTGGNGARGNARGNAVFCYHLNDGRQTRFERYDVMGVVKELPDWARERLAVLQSEREAKKAPPHEVNAGYTITESIEVGKKTFVLGENMDAGDKYVTWQHMEGRTGFDLGHYFTDRDRAVADLHKRADNERESLASGKSAKRRNRDDAR